MAMMDMMSSRSGALEWIEQRRRGLSIVGAAAFFVGYVIAVITGLWFSDNGELILTLVLLGLVVGALNVTSAEVVPYLVAATALVLIGSNQVFTPLNLVADGLGERVNLIVRLMAVFTAPAAVIQAIRAGMILARPGEDDSIS